MVNWSGFPDLTAVVLLAIAFGSVARCNQTPVSKLWLIGWTLVVLHFAASLFIPISGLIGTLAAIIGISALNCAGLLFMWAAVADRHETFSRLILATLLATTTLYISLQVIGPAVSWALDPAAALLGGLPLAIAIANVRKFRHPLRRGLVAHYCALSIFLLLVQHRPGNGGDLALDAVLFTAFFGCCLHFWHMYKRATTGAFITIAGFFAWASVFVLSPAIAALLPQAQIQSEVWNLPKYVVAVGMILLQLEDQIKHNQFLALHDALTSLPNRRLFQDRLEAAMERSRRNNTQTALLAIDLDRFKEINDTLGHHVGDLLLQRTGSIFLGRVRRTDTVARTGGDEFAVILEGITTRRDAMHVGKALIQLLNQPMLLEGHTVSVNASMGIALFPEDATDMKSLCIEADRRMYEVKHQRGSVDDPSRAELADPVTGLSLRALKSYGLSIVPGLMN